MVADMVRQFSDRYAFVRELVQNGLDANASELHVEAALGANGTTTFCVRDNGEGMTRETIEGPLLTLFRSAKDQDDDKIGKYGVGFVSVFAMNPHQVVVETWRSEGSWTVVVGSDHSYALSSGRPRSNAGTIVTLVCRYSPQQAASHVAGVHAALRHWCCHAGIPIYWRARGVDTAVDAERIDREFGVDSIVSVRGRFDDVEVVAGPTVGDVGRACEVGFYNRGLLLYQTTESPHEVLDGLCVKIMSPHLQHTLSRDNIRHDRAYRRAVARAATLVRDSLGDTFGRACREAALACAMGQSCDRYVALLHVAQRPVAFLRNAAVWFPLTDEIDGSRVWRVPDSERPKDIPCAQAPSEMTRVMAREGQLVVLGLDTSLQIAMDRLISGRLSPVEAMHTLIVPAPLGTHNALCVSVLRALNEAGIRSVERVRVADVYGVAERAAVAHTGDGATIVDRDSWPDWSSWWTTASAIVLLGTHHAVAAAASLAVSNPRAAGALLARYLLVEQRGELKSKVSDALLRTSLVRSKS